MARVGFVGLGVMGAPMAEHLVKAGHEVAVWNRTRHKEAPLAELGAATGLELADLPRGRDVVILCVAKSEDVREVLHRMIPNADPGTLFIDHSTIAPMVAEELHEVLGERNLRFLDAPITGGSMGARTGQLTIFVGGSEIDFEAARPILAAYAKRAELVGGPGKGQMMKLANQIAVGGALMGLCESLAFAERADLELEQTRSLLASGAAGSWAFENYGPKILSDDHTPGFSIDNQLKDFGYCREAAEQVGALIPGTELVESLLLVLQHTGYGHLATTALFELLLTDQSAESEA